MKAHITKCYYGNFFQMLFWHPLLTELWFKIKLSLEGFYKQILLLLLIKTLLQPISKTTVPLAFCPVYFL